MSESNANVSTAAEESINLLQSVLDDGPDNVLKMYFVQKSSNNNGKGYNSFRPEINNDVQKKIISMALPNAIKSLKLNVVKYNPIGVADQEIELLNQSQVEFVQIFKESLDEGEVFTDLNTLKVGRISFYVLAITYQGRTIYLFRQFTKMSKLRKGLIMQLFDNELREMENEFLGLDPYVDMVLLDDTLFVLNHISLERIFNYRDEFLKNTVAAMGEILNQDIMENVEEFADDCKSDVRIMKRFTNIMSQSRLPLFFDHFDKVPEIVNELGLDIEFNDYGKMIYRDKSQLFVILSLMSDAYFKSLLTDRIGMAKTEEPVSLKNDASTTGKGGNI